MSIDYEREYDNSGRVANAAELLTAFPQDAALFRKREGLIADLGLSYGPSERNAMDIFWPDETRDAPLVVFIHGGYWQRLGRSDFSHMASGLLDQGIAVAIPSYTLCPDVTVAGIVTEMRRACLLLHKTYDRPLTVVGHSAGGHLAACLFATNWAALHESLPEDLVSAGVGISGLYDLEPLLNTSINIALDLDEESAHAVSPVHWMPPALHRFDAWVGGDESDEYHRQSRTLARRWTMSGTTALMVEAEGTNHFTIVDALTDPQSSLVQRIVKLVGEPTDAPELDEPDDEAIAAVLSKQEHPETEDDAELQTAKPTEEA